MQSTILAASEGFGPLFVHAPVHVRQTPRGYRLAVEVCSFASALGAATQTSLVSPLTQHNSLEAIVAPKALPSAYHSAHQDTQDNWKAMSESNTVAIAAEHHQSESEHDFPIPSSEDGGDSDSENEATTLQKSLTYVLGQEHFSFPGNFYHAAVQKAAPNPCISVQGVGVVGLPLSEHEAKRIISAASLAPFGHGENTVVDKAVRDTWEIEPEKIAFVNPAWQKYIDGTVCRDVCTGLGVSASASKLELYKLLLYEAGSHFLPHQDTQKANGMFATVIIILPSAYEGGQLVVSHASSTKTVDFSKDSLIATAVLAWYTDVRHEVKPITSGYRLALSYNLIHTSHSTELCPTLPDIGQATELLEKALRTWKHQLERRECEQHFVAYLLDHEYSLMNMSDGKNFLKGADAHRVRSIQPIAESLGFILGFASLEQHLSGEADDDGCDYYARQRRCYSSDEDDDDERGDHCPDMVEVGSVDTKLTSLTGLDGKPLLGVTRPMKIPESALIPPNPFRNVEPDDQEYEGYMGNGAGGVEHWYRRTVLLILNAKKRNDLLFEVEGLPLAFKLLEKNFANPPSADNLDWAALILRRRSNWTKENLIAMMKYSLQWKNLDLWTETTKCPLCTVEVVGANSLIESCQTFSFNSVHLSLEEILARSGPKSVMDKILLIEAISAAAISDAERSTIEPWSSKETQKALASFTTLGSQDVPVAVALIKRVGFKQFTEHMLPDLRLKTKNYEFWQSFFATLWTQEQAIVDHLASTSSSAASDNVEQDPQAPIPEPEDAKKNQRRMLRSLMKECMSMACRNALTVTPPPKNYSYYGQQPQFDPFPTRLQRTILLIEQCLRRSYMDICGRLLQRTLKMAGDPTAKFTKFYVPLIPSLTSLLARYKKHIAMEPFAAFANKLIGQCLAEILGKKGHVLAGGVRKLGCSWGGCADCADLDKFMRSGSELEVFRVNKDRRVHLERQLQSASDLCTTQHLPYGRPQGLRVQKKPAVLWACSWTHRLADIKKFLASFGSNEVLSAIMGPRLQDVHAALAGALYVVPEDASAEAVSQTTAPPPATTSSVPTLPSNGTLQPIAAPTGTKRKTAPLRHLGVIDLTEEDSS